MYNLRNLPGGVKLMAVTKGRSVEEINKVVQLYTPALIGESRWQEAKEKLQFLPNHIKKHFIGHVQSNKIKDIVVHFDCIESVDSLKLINIINKHVETLHATSLLKNDKYPIFLQVNISNDPNKYGFTVEQLPEAIDYCKKMFHVELSGLMAITAKQPLDQTRRDFKHIKQLQQFYQLEHLSMGMSADWKIAVEEGATIIRLGRILFEE